VTCARVGDAADIDDEVLGYLKLTSDHIKGS